MTTITIDRAVVEQALEVLQNEANELRCFRAMYGDLSNVWWNRIETIAAIRLALREALNAPVPVGYITVWGPDKFQFTECVGAKLADLEQKVFPVYIEPPLREALNVPQPEPVFATHMIVCPDCGNKRCPKAYNTVMRCTGSNALGQNPQPMSVDQISMIFNRVYPAQPLSQNIINLVQEVEKHHGIR